MMSDQCHEPRIESGCCVLVSASDVLDPASDLAYRQDAQEHVGVVDLCIPFSHVVVTTITFAKLGVTFVSNR